MAFSVGTLFGYLRLDASQFDRGIASAQRDLNLAAESATRMGGAVAEGEVALTGAGRAAGMAGQQSAKLRAAQLSLVAAQERYNTLLADGSASTARLASSEASLIRAQERLKASNPAPVIRSTGTAAAESSSLIGAATSKLGGFVSTAAKFGLALGGFEAAFKGVELIKAGAQFQAQMRQIQTLTGGTAAEVKNMSKSVLGLAGAVGTAPEQLATSLYHVESVGLRGAKALDVVKIAAEGAKVGMSDVEETTNALTSTVASGIKGVENMSQAMGALVTIVGAGDMKMSDLNEALGGGILSVVKGYGLSLSDVGAALATFGDNNIRGADAATALRMAVMAFAAPAAAGHKQLEALGLSTTRLRDDMQKGGLNKAILDLRDHLQAAGVTGSKVGGVLTEVFGKRAGVGLAVLMGQVDRFETKLTEINKGSGSFQSKWTETTKNVSFAFHKLGAEAEVAGIKIFNKVGPAAADAANWLGSTLPHAVTALQDTLQPLEREVGIVLVGAWKAFATVVSVAASALSTIGGFLREHKTLVNGVGSAVLAMWATYKGYQIASAAIRAVGDLFAGLRLKALNAGLSMRSAAASASGMQMIAGGALAGIGAAVGIATVLWQRHAAAVAKTKQEIQSLTDAIQQDNGAIGDNTKAGVANLLYQQGAFAAAQKLGISTNDLFDAITQLDSGAIDRINAALAAYQKNSKGVSADADPLYSSYQKVSDALTGTSGKLHDAVQGYQVLSRVTGTATDAAQRQATAQGVLAQQSAYVIDSQGNLMETTQGAATALDATTTAMGKQKTASELLKTALDTLNGVNLSVEQTQNAQADALNTFVDAVKAARKANDGNAASLDRSTETGLKNRENLVNLIQSYKDAAQATADKVAADKGQTEGLKAGNKYLKDQEDKLIALAKQLGINVGDVKGLTTSIGQLSHVKADPKISADTKPAYTKLTAFRNQARKNITAILDLDTTHARAKLAQMQHLNLQMGVNKRGGLDIPGHWWGGNLDAGWNKVGEKGPELVNGTTGQVLTNAQTNAHGGGERPIIVNVTNNNPVPLTAPESTSHSLRQARVALGGI